MGTVQKVQSKRQKNKKYCTSYLQITRNTLCSIALNNIFLIHFISVINEINI